MSRVVPELPSVISFGGKEGIVPFSSARILRGFSQMCAITRLFWLGVLLPVVVPEAEKHAGRVIAFLLFI